MAYNMPVDHLGAPMHNYMEPETVTRDSDDDSVVSRSTPGSRPKGDTDTSSGILQRAASSSSVGGLGVEGISMSAADKKRNKLGYHRTAVACGHCRRRKIRCIPAFEDTSGRCQNCIRLKKDCHFFPVDQQNMPVGRSARAGSKGDNLLADDETAVSSAEFGAPPILKSTPDVRMGQINGLMQGPLSPEETAGFPPYGEYLSTGARPSDGAEYNQSQSYVGHHQHYGQRSQSFNAGMQPASLHGRPDATIPASPYYAQAGSAMIPAPHHPPPQSAQFSGQVQVSEVQPSWAVSTVRSIPTTGSEEHHDGYRPYPAHRIETYPSDIRRSSEAQYLAYGIREQSESFGAPYSQDSLARQHPRDSPERLYHDLPQHHSGGYSQHLVANSTHVPGSSGVAYPLSWYTTPGHPYVQQEDDQGHTYVGNNYGRNQP